MIQEKSSEELLQDKSVFKSEMIPKMFVDSFCLVQPITYTVLDTTYIEHRKKKPRTKPSSNSIVQMVEINDLPPSTEATDLNSAPHNRVNSGQ